MGVCCVFDDGWSLICWDISDIMMLWCWWWCWNGIVNVEIVNLCCWKKICVKVVMKPCVCCVMDEGLKLNCCVIHDIVVLLMMLRWSCWSWNWLISVDGKILSEGVSEPCVCCVSVMMVDYGFVKINSDVVMSNDVKIKVLWLVE